MTTTAAKSMSKILVPPSLTDRYFSLHYALNGASRFITDNKSEQEPKIQPLQNKPPTEDVSVGFDSCIARHHNGICMVCISPRHPLVTGKDIVTRVEYRVPFREVKGKRKRGGIIVEKLTKLCLLTCESGKQYKIQCSTRGVIVEYNTALEDTPSLVNQLPLRDGYLAVILPFMSEMKTSVDELTSQSDYDSRFEVKAELQ